MGKANGWYYGKTHANGIFSEFTNQPDLKKKTLKWPLILELGFNSSFHTGPPIWKKES